MKILAFIGQHQKDDWTARLGWAIVRLAQIGARFNRCTHVESHLAGPWYDCAIGSSTLRKTPEGKTGVRTRPSVRLNPEHWMVIDMPMWDVEDTLDWHELHDGSPYAWLGSIATILWFLPQIKGQENCVMAVGKPHGVIDVHRMTTAAFIAHCMSLPGSRDVTDEFFADAEPK